jgi:hypothetical protein
MTAVWPSTMPPSPLITGWQDELADGRIISKTTYGIGKRRALWKGVQKITASYNLTGEQFNLLNIFWEQDTRHGIDTFFWIAPPIIAGYLQTNTYDFLTNENGVPLGLAGYVLVQFGPQPPRRSQAYTQDVFKVDVDIEVLP